MGNRVGKLGRCFAGDVSGRHRDVYIHPTQPLDVDLGHSFCYIKPGSSNVYSDQLSLVQFQTISGACISANSYTPLTTTLSDPFSCTSTAIFDKASSFESSRSFASIPLQPVFNNSSAVLGSGPIERGFLSGSIERNFSERNQASTDHLTRSKPKCIMKSLKKAMSKSSILSGGKRVISCSGIGSTSSDFSGNEVTVVDDEEGADGFQDQKVEWAHGKAGEDRVHVVVSEENGWVFVGIYDGFNGPDATEFLLGNLYSNVYKELKGLLWNEKSESTAEGACINSNKASSGFAKYGSKSVKHSDVLKALSQALRKTEESFLEITDMMVKDNPEVALMGSCVLVMLMKGDDVYLMNVGDSRAVLGQKLHLERIDEKKSTDLEIFKFDAFSSVSSLAALQLTFDHCTSVQEEVKRIKREHRDDSSAIVKNRVKGSLNVTRAFGAGFLKQPKWNNALLEMFRIDYVGNSPYLSCSPSLRYHKLGPKDRFLILSSDGLYQYFTNEQAVAQVEVFMSLFPEGDPAQHLVEEVLIRAAKKAGLRFNELLNILQEDRRKYHDDVSVIVISFEGRIWRSAV
ncbi:hypothetical protein DCAR_0520469 [Daucus carota subsp. sativus]|uniref:protein-serine/threonine phosphatase n=1 Tax=Daucus carota subsp. sativus TaxID=79200 RepID=A0AAF0X4P6_DAUCS|nr:PREDICTED: probable protein phosphatase 2C 4 [Daucus carota subsp. sativus]WOH01090.1 hypothetical protein DCAR_0520469 [Daucus carota subsp. sativus]